MTNKLGMRATAPVTWFARTLAWTHAKFLVRALARRVARSLVRRVARSLVRLHVRVHVSLVARNHVRMYVKYQHVRTLVKIHARWPAKLRLNNTKADSGGQGCHKISGC